MSTKPTEQTASSDPVVQLGLPSPIILGSASFTRKLILKEMGIQYCIVVRSIDEKSLGNRDNVATTDELVLTLAKAKMSHLVEEIQAGRCAEDLSSCFSSFQSGDNNVLNGIVLTGDQVVTCNGAILEKPESVEEAKRFVRSYVHHPPSTVGSVVLTHLPTNTQVSGVDTATIHFRSNLDGDDLIDRLLADDDGKIILSCAGGLMVEHPFVKEYIERIDGTEDSVMGLSKKLVLELLRELKDKVKDKL